MKYFYLLLLLASCSATPQDLSMKVFTFPQASKEDHVRLNTPQQQFNAITVCLRSFTDLKRDHNLFSMSTASHDNSFLIFWSQAPSQIAVYVRNGKTEFYLQDYKLNMWHSICTTWDSVSGLVQLWFDGTPSARKYVVAGQTEINEPPIITLGQEQDSHGGGFDAKQSFVGMKTDVHMWNYVISPCEMQRYADDQLFTPGNVLNWKALEFQSVGKVLIESRQMTCV